MTIQNSPQIPKSDLQEIRELWKKCIQDEIVYLYEQLGVLSRKIEDNGATFHSIKTFEDQRRRVDLQDNPEEAKLIDERLSQLRAIVEPLQEGIEDIKRRFDACFDILNSIKKHLS